MDGENGLARNHLSLFLGELATPRDTFVGGRPFTSVVVLVLGLYAHEGNECTDSADDFLHFIF